MTSQAPVRNGQESSPRHFASGGAELHPGAAMRTDVVVPVFIVLLAPVAIGLERRHRQLQEEQDHEDSSGRNLPLLWQANDGIVWVRAARRSQQRLPCQSLCLADEGCETNACQESRIDQFSQPFYNKLAFS